MAYERKREAIDVLYPPSLRIQMQVYCDAWAGRKTETTMMTVTSRRRRAPDRLVEVVRKKRRIIALPQQVSA